MKATPAIAPLRQGFTLVELIIVIAILAFVTVVGIHSYGNLKETQARKMNLANIKRVHHTLATYDAAREEDAGRFNYFDALIDAKPSGAWTGAPGTFAWNDVALAGGGVGVYDGSWKELGIPLSNAGGQGAKTYTLAEAQDSNKGLRNTGLLSKLAIHYLSTNECQLLHNAGIAKVLLHNPSTAQSSAYCAVPTGVYSPGGGGPGFRPDMSAYYPADLVAGSPVAVIRPVETSRGVTTCSSIYTDFGYGFATTNSSPDAVMGTDTKVTLVCFGIGRGAECVRSQLGLGEAPYNPAYDKTNYRQYIAVFAIREGGQGVASTCHLAGVLDCAGNTYKQAEYGVNWTTQVN